MFSTTRALLARIAALEAAVDRLTARCNELAQSSAEGLRSRITDVEGAVDAHVASTRKEFGRVWIKFRERYNISVDRNVAPVDDEEFRAYLELQNATKPNGSTT